MPDQGKPIKARDLPLGSPVLFLGKWYKARAVGAQGVVLRSIQRPAEIQVLPLDAELVYGTNS